MWSWNRVSLKTLLRTKSWESFFFLNFDDNKNIDVKVEEEKLKEYLDSWLLENSGWFFTSSRRYIKSERSHFKFKKVAEFIIRRDYSLSIWVFHKKRNFVIILRN